MTLDDRSLREHLDRRAGAGSAEPARIADAVIERIEAGGAEPWWRGSSARLPGFAFVSAAVVVVLVAAALAPSVLRPTGPGSSSPSASVSGPSGSGYPATEALDASGLAALLGDDPTARASILVVADVQLVPIRRLCSPEPRCPTMGVQIPGTDRYVPVFVPPDLQGAPSPYAFRVTTDGSLEMVGPVRTGPSGLSWGFAQLTSELKAIRDADVAWHQLYLVESRLSIDPGSRFCALQVRPLPSPFFGCGSYVAWLQPLDASYPPAEPPADGIRVPNVLGWRERSDALFEAGFFLIDPTASVEDCFLCGPLGAADLLGRVLPAAELGDAGPTGAPPVDPGARALNPQELAALLDDGTHQRAGAIAIAAVQLTGQVLSCDALDCPDHEIRIPGRAEPVIVWTRGPEPPLLNADFAFRFRSDGALDLLGTVRPGPERLAWGLPSLIDELAAIRTRRGGGVDLYLVDAWLATAQMAYPCPYSSGSPDQLAFACSNGQAWLVPDQASIPASPDQMPANGLRLPNSVASEYGAGSGAGRGYWLIDPAVAADPCFMCPPAGAVDLLGQVVALGGEG